MSARRGGASAGGCVTADGERDAARRGGRAWTGRVVWVTGLSGSGKTTVAATLVRRLRRAGVSAVLLDGDALRPAIAADLGYGLADRRRAAERYARLAGVLAAQGLTVVVATISMFEAVRRANRRRLPRYYEVYLRLRDGVLPRARPGTAALVVGRGLPFEEPRHPDLVCDAPVASRRAGVIAAAITRGLARGA